MQNSILTGYAGSYEHFNTLSKGEASILLGADCLVGDRFSIVFQTDEQGTRAWMKNRFGALVAYFSEETSRTLQIYHARGWVLTALLSFVAFSDTPDPGEYWGEAAVICYDPSRASDAFERFIDAVGKKMEDSLRPDISLGPDGVSHVIETNGDWMPTVRIPLPQKEAGMVILKRRRKLSDSLIEQGRAGNKGCYAISWAFIIILAFAVIIGVYWLLTFFGLI